MRNLTKTRVGRALVAVRDSDIAAECIGVNITYYKTLAFAISAFYTGIGGGLMAFVLGFINPHTFNVMVSVIFLAMVVGGRSGLGIGIDNGELFSLPFCRSNSVKLPKYRLWDPRWSSSVPIFSP